MGPMSPVCADSRWAGLCPVKLTEKSNGPARAVKFWYISSP